MDVEVIGGASRGCTAVLRCVVPSFVRDLVRVVSWLQEPAFYIYPSLQGGKRRLIPIRIHVYYHYYTTAVGSLCASSRGKFNAADFNVHNIRLGALHSSLSLSLSLSLRLCFSSLVRVYISTSGRESSAPLAFITELKLSLARVRLPPESSAAGGCCCCCCSPRVAIPALSLSYFLL